MFRWLVAMAVLLLAARAGAQQPPAAPFVLHWLGPATCPSEPEVVREVQRLLGGSAAALPAVRIEADARISAANNGFKLLLRVSSSEGSRSRNLEAPSCPELARAAALVVALAVDPSLAHAGAEGSDAQPIVAPLPCPEPAPPAPPPACPACARCPPVSPARRPAPARLWNAALVAGTSVAYGELPRLVPRPNLGLAYRVPSYWFELSAGVGFASSGRLASGGVATFSLWYAAPRACVEPNLGWARIGGCALVELGVLTGSGFGVLAPKTQREWWVAPGIGLQLSRRLPSGAELVVGIDALIPAIRPRFELDSEPVFRPHLIVPTLRLGVNAGLF